MQKQTVLGAKTFLGAKTMAFAPARCKNSENFTVIMVQK